MENKSIKGSRTERNLLKAFAGESQAKNRYEFFAKQARKEGYQQIAGIFEETAMQEKEHAKTFFKFLEGGMVEIAAAYPAGAIGNTMENLKAAAEGENEEWEILYPQFAEIAKEEGYPKVAAKFNMVAKVEAEHEKRFLKLLENIENGVVFEKEKPVKWMCRNCGYIHEGPKALQNCPACDHSQAYFELHSENY
ncbi:MAG: rubrerythrin [Bacteroidales bacterium]|jgi:rubrerythrin|nr:rubrerythrin family protein [Bacteroidales bacterium]